MKLEVYTMRRTVYEGETTRVTLPTITGEISVMENHEPYVTVLTAGELCYTRPFKEGATEGESEEKLQIKGGFLEVRENNEVRILADE